MSKTLLVEDQNGWFRVTVPDEAKCTFGPAVPFQPKGGYNIADARGYSLRVYENGSKENPIAVFTGVNQYRLESIKVERRVLHEEGTTVWKSDEEGVRVETQKKRKSKMVDEAFLLETKL